ncbi:helix-turn-helix domain-containing protein [Antribacter sp. KLBMP9083]|uniref:Helix-turn-helix domain-containing protein n=1 Tax=Antribacter soli TaxID=2910976 RepID=A0AA41U9L6_9MICO|nr:helix-turn-helix domain-containing protein [Antribacter soli]MCF4121742.1 helix-turn-helix domain-containing protein [Antribacter soli]
MRRKTTTPTAATTIEELWTIEDVAAFLRVPVATLYRWRTMHTGPAAYRVGRHLRYDPATVRAWLTETAAA